MANQFYVDPMGGFNLGGALSGLGQQFGQQRKEAQASRQQQDMQAFMRQAIDGDPVAMKEVMARNPEMGLKLQQVEQERLARLGAEQKAVIDERNMDYAKRYKFASPEEKQMILQEAIQDPSSDLWDEEDINISPDQAMFESNVLLGMKPETAMATEGKDAEALTARQKDFNQYQQLRKTDPVAAKAFGTGAGFVQDDQKRIFKIQDGVKYFSDGTEAPLGPKDKLKSDDMRSAMSKEQALKIVDKAKEGQLKNAGFAITMNDGTNKVNKMMSEGYDPTSAAWVNKYLAGTTIGNLAMSEDDQIFVGAVEQMINAIARRETGAAITEFERKDFFNRYMPVAGDKPARIKQKKAALERQFKSIRGQAGSVYDAIRVTQGFDEKPAEQPKVSTQVIIKAHPKYGDVTEDDIKETMSQSGMTREQVIAKLGG